MADGRLDIIICTRCVVEASKGVFDGAHPRRLLIHLGEAGGRLPAVYLGVVVGGGGGGTEELRGACSASRFVFCVLIIFPNVLAITVALLGILIILLAAPLVFFSCSCIFFVYFVLPRSKKPRPPAENPYGCGLEEGPGGAREAKALPPGNPSAPR